MRSLSPAADERRNGRIYLVGLAFSLLGNSAMTLVAGVWLKTLTGSTSAAALVSVCVYAPSLLGPLAGLLADRVPIRGLLLAVNLGSAAMLLPLLLVRSTGEAWLIYVVMTAYGLSAVLIDPAESALFAVLFRPEARARINGLRITVQESGKLVAPLVGVALYTALGGGAVAALDSLTFVIAAVAVALLRTAPIPRATATRHWRRDVLAGLHHIGRTSELRTVVLLAAGAMAVSGLLVAAQFDLVAALHRPPSFLGVLSGALGAGSIVAGLVSGRLVVALGELRVVSLGLVDAAAGSVLRAVGWTPAAVLGSIVLGFALPWVVVAALTLAQRTTPTELQGRVAAALTLALFAPLPVMQVVGTALSVHLDYRTLYLATASVQLAMAGWGSRRRAQRGEQVVVQ